MVIIRDATPDDAPSLLPLIAEMGAGFDKPSGADADVYAAGRGEVRVVTDADNLAAIRVYEKAGIGGDLICLHRHFGAGPHGDE